MSDIYINLAGLREEAELYRAGADRLREPTFQGQMEFTNVPAIVKYREAVYAYQDLVTDLALLVEADAGKLRQLGDVLAETDERLSRNLPAHSGRKIAQ